MTVHAAKSYTNRTPACGTTDYDYSELLIPAKGENTPARVLEHAAEVGQACSKCWRRLSIKPLPVVVRRADIICLRKNTESVLCGLAVRPGLKTRGTAKAFWALKPQQRCKDCADLAPSRQQLKKKGDTEWQPSTDKSSRP